ncbi:MAG TPA: lipoprotein-releasing system ATP-binding protein LolD [Chitinophagaceae bacterium]|nr:lipoprotein-releasing system ATP-binding protein LolD [Chitinophagaceae bacterium]
MLVARGIKKAYEQVSVLRGVDIEVQKSEIVSIVGSSGAGKSTLLHVLGTLDKADAGSITLHGQPIHSLKGKALANLRNKHMGFIFQFHHLLPEFSALENVCIPGWIAKKPTAQLQKDAAQWLEVLGLSDRLHHKPNQLSGGEQQRVAVARALINRPDIVFADEPTGNLDTANAQQLHDIFVQLRNNFGQAFLIVTHNEQLASQSNRILKMKDGVIIEQRSL